MSKTFIVLIILFCVSIFAFFAVKDLYPTKAVLPKLSEHTAATAVPQSMLSLAPATFTVTPGSDSSVNVTLNSNGEKPTLVQFEIAYDPLVITAVSTVPGNFFTNPTVVLNTVDQNTGRISYAIEAEQAATEQQGTVATIHFRVSPYTMQKETALYFLPKTMIKSTGTSNILKAGYGSKIIIVPSFSQPVTSTSAIQH